MTITNVNIEGYQSGFVIKVTGWKTFREIIVPLFANPTVWGLEWERQILPDRLPCCPSEGLLQLY
jgi:hypothetical protein